MDIDRFWNLVEESRQRASTCEGQAEALVALLRELPPEEIISFDNHFRARERESYRWDLWAVAYVVNGGCSDDGFDYFRGWLIARGRDYFEAALASAERAAADDAAYEGAWCEDILYAAYRAYEGRTGHKMPHPTVIEPIGEPAGEPWDEDDLDQLYPRLTRRFWAHWARIGVKPETS